MSDKAAEEEANDQVQQILALPFINNNTKLYDNANDQFQCFMGYVDGKIKECREKMAESACIFAVNHIQNRFIVSELTVELANVFEILQVRRASDFHLQLDTMKGDQETTHLMRDFHDCTARWDAFLDEIDAIIDDKIGPSDVAPTNSDSRAPFAYLMNEVPSTLYLISIVRAFTDESVKQYILALYNKMDEMKKMGCEVYLLTRGPSIGSQGGSYLKLIGVPFRKVCDENQAQAELKSHRQRAKRIAGWNSLLQVVEATISDENRAKSRQSSRDAVSDPSDAAAFIASQTGCILVDRTGNVHFKFVEDEYTKSWPDSDILMSEIKKKGIPPPSSADNTQKAALEKPSNNDSSSSELDKKGCCTIL